MNPSLHPPLNASLSQRTRADLTLSILLSIALAWMFQVHFRQSHVDYNTFDEAGRLLLEGRISELYAPERSSMGGFLYPLGAAGFFAVFAALGSWAGRLVFYFLLSFCLIGVFRWCRKHLADSVNASRRALWLTLLLGARSINDSWLSGNISLLLLGLTLLAFDFYFGKNPGKNPKPNAAAAALGFGISLKLLPAVMGAFWVWNRDWKFLLRLAVAVAAFYLAPYLLVALFSQSWETAWNLVLAWQGTLKNPANFGTHTLIHFQNISAGLHRLSDALSWNDRWIMPTLVTLAAVLTLAPLLHKARSRQALTPALQNPMAQHYAALLSWIPLLSPVTWHHVGVFYLPLLYATAVRATSPQQLASRLQLAAFFCFYTLTGKDVLGPTLHAWVSHHSLPLVGIFALVLPATHRVISKWNSDRGAL